MHLLLKDTESYPGCVLADCRKHVDGTPELIDHLPDAKHEDRYWVLMKYAREFIVFIEACISETALLRWCGWGSIGFP